MKRLSLLIFVFIFPFSSLAETKPEYNTVGCWESNTMDFGNSLTVCVNYDSAAISFLFLNKDEKTGISNSTVCSQIADVEYENENTLIVRGFSGKCRNGRQQAAITLKCTFIESERMPCEMYLEHKDLTLTKVKNRK